MYNTTTTTPEIQISPGLGANSYSMSITATAVPRYRRTPEDIKEYLMSMGWSAYTGSDSDAMYTRNDIGLTNYMTWEQAVTYCLIKPFLHEVKK